MQQEDAGEGSILQSCGYVSSELVPLDGEFPRYFSVFFSPLGGQSGLNLGISFPSGQLGSDNMVGQTLVNQFPLRSGLLKSSVFQNSFLPLLLEAQGDFSPIFTMGTQLSSWGKIFFSAVFTEPPAIFQLQFRFSYSSTGFSGVFCL